MKQFWEPSYLHLDLRLCVNLADRQSEPLSNDLR
jgi:hypothetical protein